MDNLVSKSATELRRLIQSRELSARDVVDAHIRRIEAVNPELNAIVTTTFDAAIEAADEIDRTGAVDAPLAGLPIAHKDLVPTAGIRTTFGSTLHKDDIPEVDALIVTRMRQAGAITIGKTNTPEFGAGSQTFNRVFGATKNPYDLSKTCGGSSGGAAVALASRMLPLADGSDMGGSLRNPAAFCNVLGFRASPGRVPAWPGGNPWFDLGVSGAMARSVDDLALLFSVLAGPDPRVHNVLPEPGSTFSPVEPARLEGLRIAVTTDFGRLPVATDIRARVESVAAELAAAGATVEEASPDLVDARRIFHILRASSFRRFAALDDEQRRELKDTIIWNMEAGVALSNADYDWVYPARAALIERVAEFFNDYDLLIGPTTQVQPFDLDTDWVREVDGQAMRTYIQWMESCSLITTTACPALSMPAGFANGLPIGIQLIAPLRADKALLEYAKAIEPIVSSAHEEPALDT